ncbi:MAG: trypsin-like serine protease [Moorea sp. SIO2B7]|nr:trypsin-like serine protease [Moorena sp. SIO2B7]
MLFTMRGRKTFITNIRVTGRGGTFPATLVNDPDFDLAVIKIPTLLTLRPLILNLSGSYQVKETDAFSAMGYSKVSTTSSVKKFSKISGTFKNVDDEIACDKDNGDHAGFWKVQTHGENNKIYSGNSGSPVLNKNKSIVLGVLSFQGGNDSNKGWVISIEALEKTWREMPRKLRPPSISPTNSRADYTKLHDLLAGGKWKEANDETVEIVFQIYERIKKEQGKETGGHLTSEDLNDFPSEDLLTIDKLWSYYSNGYFGISVQNDIYMSLDGKNRDERWEQLYIKLRWAKITNGKLEEIKYDQLNFEFEYEELNSESDSPPKGYLPYLGKIYELNGRRFSAETQIVYGPGIWQIISHRFNKFRLGEVKELKEKKEVLEQEVVRLKQEIESHKQINYKNEQIINLLINMTLQKPDRIDIQQRLNSLEKQLNDQIQSKSDQCLIKMGRYKIHPDNAGSLKSDAPGERYEEFWIDFNHHFHAPPIVYVSISGIDCATEIYSRDVKWNDLNAINSLKFISSLAARFPRLEVFVKDNSVTNNGFTAITHTWWDSKVFGLDIAWIATSKRLTN